MKLSMTIKPDVNVKRSRLWYLLPIFLGIIGGVAAYFYLRASDPTLAKSTLWLGIILSAIVASLALAIYIAYVRDIAAAKEKIAGCSKVVDAAEVGHCDYGKVGDCAPSLLSDGSGGSL